MDMKLKKAEDVSTASLVVTGLIGGWLTARETGIRPLGGVVLALAGGYATRSWWKKSGPVPAIGLLGTYIGAFGLSHPLAKKIGAWPAVLAVTTVASGAACVLNDIND
ncbi:hypothetical protein [Corynebacterium aquilae]|uniref:Membrane protein n=1 Tax=Corynebacterium aquilae DSM 44791 TaxID=1431546 RepID=A0A1L7CFE0_9CORY|nr:hypothetical protein [Corynebacterium aquilae]APT84590.1 membrane protein [Corynebacterium aquilae DSM 44791]